MVPSGVAGDVDQVVAFYERLGRRPIAAVLPDSDEDALFRQRGWVLESHDEDTVFQLAGVAAVRRRLPPSLAAVELREEGSTATALVDDVASGVAAVDGDWAGFRSIEVSPDRRRQGLGLTVAYLQVLGDNAPALALYDRLGFVEHHRYRYLAAPR
jgi:GNAT superfamily N-acetyltransferase